MQRIGTSKYEHRGHQVERMADGTWDAYRLADCQDDIPGARTWESPAHSTRHEAISAINMRIRRN